MGGNLGEAFGPLLVGALLAVFSWQTVVWINVVPGMLMALKGALDAGVPPEREALAQAIAGNTCRCGAYDGILIRSASKLTAGTAGRPTPPHPKHDPRQPAQLVP